MSAADNVTSGTGCRRERFDAVEVKARLRFLDLIAHEGVAVRRNGPHFIARCPFHEERSGSFTIHGPKHDHGHCYGCGWNGDIFDFWRERHGGVFADAVAACASLASVAPGVFDAKRKQASQVTRVADAPRGDRQKPALPPLRTLHEEEIVALSRLRGLDAAGVRAAANLKRVGGCEWPQFIDRDGCWRRTKDIGPSWVVTDRERWVAQFRRLDGGQYTVRDDEQIKAWTKGSPSWPLGASEIGDRAAVLLVEGGADMLAAYHFLALFRRLEKVAVCAILGGSNSIADDARPFFRGKRVRIIMDEDEWKTLKTTKGERKIKPGCEAAARWTEELSDAGAAVETFSLAGLLTKAGAKVKDLNDLAMVDEGAWLDPELRAAFFDFDF